jgi:hypothetical protein
MRRTALALAALLATTAAHAQSSIIWPRRVIDPPGAIDPEEGVPLYKRTKLPPDGWLPPDQRALAALSAPIVPAALAPPLEPVVLNGGRGGRVHEHQSRFWALKQQGAPVEMRGGCYSACTLITAFIPKDRLCFGEGSFLAFHMASTIEEHPRPHPHGTYLMYASYPTEIRQWIDAHGGPYKLTVETFWTMYDRDLWAIGYPRCK